MKFLSFSNCGLWLLLAAAFIPLSAITNFPLGPIYINAERLFLYLFIGLIFFSYIHLGLRRRGAGIFFLATMVLFIYSTTSILFLNSDPFRTFRQAELYLPFFASTALLASKIRFQKEEIEYKIYWTIVFSAATALTLYFIFPDWTQGKLRSINEEVADIFEAGRMQWSAGALSLIAVFLFFNSKNLQRNTFSSIGLFLIVIGVIATQNRTLTASLILLFILYSKINLRSLFYIGLACIVTYFFVSRLPKSTLKLFLTRFFFDDAAQEFEHAFTINRLGLYSEYFDRIISHPFFGQGLGFPYTFNHYLGTSVYTSDISIVSFLIPFGFFGLTLIFSFWKKIFVKIHELRIQGDGSYHRNLALLFITSLLVSFNIDLYSRNIFALVLTALVCNTKFNALQGGRALK